MERQSWVEKLENIEKENKLRYPFVFAVRIEKGL